MNPNHPTFHFNSIVPRLLGTGAVTALGHCWVKRAFIGAHHRAHETYHHKEAVNMGRVVHLLSYLWTLAELLVVTRFRRVPMNGHTYFAAYWFHPEEMRARAYADANWKRYTQIGVKSNAS